MPSRAPVGPVCAALMLAASAPPSRATATELTPLQAQRLLEGTWAGDGTTLTIDTERLQGNIDPERPFEWRAFRLLNVSGRMVVFDIGGARFLALLDPARTMRLTSPSFAGERALHRIGH